MDVFILVYLKNKKKDSESPKPKIRKKLLLNGRRDGAKVGRNQPFPRYIGQTSLLALSLVVVEDL